MAGRSTSIPMHAIGLFTLFFGMVLSTHVFGIDSSDSHWQNALSALEKQDGKLACEETRSWLEEQKPSSLSSPEAHHNLALCSWMQKEADTAVYEALSSLNLSNSIPKLLSESLFITQMQREIGIQRSVSANTSFLIASVATSLNCLILFSLGFWTIVLRRAFLPQSTHLKKLANLVGVILLTGAGILFLARSTRSKIGVLTGEANIVIYNFGTSEKPNPLAELPRGTLVTVGREKPGYFQIFEPVPGWVASNSLKPVLFNYQ